MKKREIFCVWDKLNENTTCKHSALRFFPLSTIFAKIEGDDDINGTDEFVIEFPLEVLVNDDDDDNGNVVVGVLF